MPHDDLARLPREGQASRARPPCTRSAETAPTTTAPEMTTQARMCPADLDAQARGPARASEGFTRGDVGERSASSTSCGVSAASRPGWIAQSIADRPQLGDHLQIFRPPEGLLDSYQMVEADDLATDAEELRRVGFSEDAVALELRHVDPELDRAVPVGANARGRPYGGRSVRPRAESSTPGRRQSGSALTARGG
jgi:hypothetical protein